jgi:ABC-2 type transport system permease protein
MFTAIIEKELLELYRDKRIRLAAGVFLLLSLFGVFNGYRHYRSMAELHEQAQQESYHQWLNQGEKNPHAGAHFGVYVFKPIAPLSMWDKGVDDYAGVSLWLEPHKQSAERFKPAQDQTSLARFGALWPALVFQLLGPLLVALMAFDSLNKEARAGCLPLLRVSKLSAQWFVAGKLFAILTAMGAVCLPAFLTSHLLVAAAVGWSQFLQSLPAAAALAGVYALYYGIFASMVLLLSGLFRAPAASFTAALSFWMVAAVIAPPALAAAARNAAPHATAFDFYRQIKKDMNQGIDGYGDATTRRAGFEAQTLVRFGVERIEDLPVNYAGIALQASEEYSYLVFDRHYHKISESFHRQRQWLGWASLLSPCLAVSLATQEWCGTGMSASLEFSQQAERHRRLIQRIVNTAYAEAAKGNDRQVVVGQELWEQTPPFQFEPLAQARIWRETRQFFLVLGLWLALILGSLIIGASTLLKNISHV